MKNDSYASPEEVAALEAQRQEAHNTAEVFEAEKAGGTGQAYPDDPFYGTDPADVKARRHAMGQFAREDYEEPTPDPIDTYTGPTSGAEVRSLEELRAFSENEENIARDKYSNYDEIIDRYVIPKLKKEGVTVQEVQEWMLSQPDFTERAYRYGLELKNQLTLPEGFEKMGGDEFGEWLNAQRGGARRESEQSPEFVSKREMRRMNRIANPVDFAKELDRLKWRG